MRRTRAKIVASLAERAKRQLESPVGAVWTVVAVALAALALAALAGDFAWVSALLGALAVLASAVMLPVRHRQRLPANVTAQEKKEAQLPHALLEAAPDPCILLDGCGAVAFANLRARDLFSGISTGQLVTFFLRAPELLDAISAARSGIGARVARFAIRMPVEQWFEAHVSPIELSDRAHAADFVMIWLRDLTQEQRIERMRADFVTNASHELRTPLASLLGFIETLQGPASGDAKARERFLPIMRAQAERMTRLINDLLSLSRIEASAHVRPRSRVDLREVLRHVADGLAPLAQENGVELTLDLPSEPLTVLGERDELVRLFENLVENAIKYGAGGGRVEVRAERADTPRPRAVVSVRDFGPGIPPEHVPRLTERFYRVDVTESRQKGGTGLGLSLVKHILTRHRGTLAIQSRLGEGSTFSVRLDLADTDSTGTDSASPSAPVRKQGDADVPDRGRHELAADARSGVPMGVGQDP